MRNGLSARASDGRAYAAEDRATVGRRLVPGVSSLRQSWRASTTVRLIALAVTTTLLPAILAVTTGAQSTGGISGRVTSSSGASLPGVRVDVYARVTTTYSLVGGATTDAAGLYAITNLPAGTYFLVTSNSLGYIDEVFNDIPRLGCIGADYAACGAGVVVVAGAVTAGRDFSLAPGGSFTGTVTDASTGARLQGVTVHMTNPVLGPVLGYVGYSATTNASGSYTVPRLPTGTYFAFTTNSASYSDEIYDNIPCPTFDTCQSTLTGARAAAANGTPIAVTAGTVTTGRDFALELTGSITGTVTNAGTGAPLQGVTINLYRDSAGTPVLSGQASTNSSGQYAITQLPRGTYFAMTSNSLGYFNEIFDDISCTGTVSCTPTTAIRMGTAIQVASGAAVSGRNFALTLGGSITGIVTDSSTGNPLQSVAVWLSTVSGGTIYAGLRSGVTDATGTYTIRGLADGTYYAATVNTHGYINEVFDNIPCTGFCTATSSQVVQLGTGIQVTVGGTAAGVNFGLDIGGSITGTITGAGGTPVQGVAVSIYSRRGGTAIFAGNALSSSTGVYTVRGLPSGTYYALTSAAARGYVSEIFNDVACPGLCSTSVAVSVGAPIAVAAGASSAGIDFQLLSGGSISGTVRDDASGAPVPNTPVDVYTRVGSTVARAATASTNSSGAYTLAGLPAGTYFARTNSATHLDEIHDDIPCGVECSPGNTVARGAPIAVTAGAPTSGKDFSLLLGGSISGTVTDVSSGAPLPDVRVTLLGPGSVILASVTDASGQYRFDGLPNGTYYLYTETISIHYIDKIYDDIECPGDCSADVARRSGTGILVTQGTSTSGKDFRLRLGGRVTGRITSAGDGTPISGIDVVAFLRSGNEFSGVSRGRSQSDGTYTISGLPAGSYFLSTQSVLNNPLGYIDQIYRGIACLGSCREALPLGETVPVTIGATTADRDFALVAGARISGRITDSATGAPIANALVSIYTASGRFVTTGAANARGEYITYSGLPTGTYFAHTTNSVGYVNEIFDNIKCPGVCSPEATIASGTGISATIGTTTTGKDFALDAGGGISGAVTDAATGAPLADVTVNLYARSGSTFVLAESRTTDSLGQYSTRAGLLGRTYYAFTSNVQRYLDEVFDNIPCPTPCSPLVATTRGTGIIVEPGSIASGRDFALVSGAGGVPGPPANLTAVSSGAGVVFAWTAPETGGIATGYVLEAGFSSGATAVTIPTTEVSYTVATIPAGRYFLRVRGVNAIGSGPPSEEYELVVGAAAALLPATPRDLTASMLDRRLTLSWSQPASGGQPGDFLVEVGTASGLSNLAALPVGTTAFTYSPVPDGVYFLRVRARNAVGVSGPSNEVVISVGNVASPPGPPQNFGAVASGSLVTLSWERGVGSPTSYLLEAGTATGLSNLAVVTLPGTATTATFSGVPPGTYFVRLRAVNAAGASVASSEVRLVVP